MSISCELKPEGGHHGEGVHLMNSLTQIKAKLRGDVGKRPSSIISIKPLDPLMSETDYI